MLEKACKSSTRDYLGFSASDIADGISKLAVNASNSKQVSLICPGYTVYTCTRVQKGIFSLRIEQLKLLCTSLKAFFSDLVSSTNKKVQKCYLPIGPSDE